MKSVQRDPSVPHSSKTPLKKPLADACPTPRSQMEPTTKAGTAGRSTTVLTPLVATDVGKDQPIPRWLVAKAQLNSIFGINFSNCHLIRLERDGKFPRRLYVGNRPYWIRSEIKNFIQTRAAERAHRRYGDY